MLNKKIDAVTYKESFAKKFTNFAEKSPVVISFAFDDIGVTVVHDNSGKKYFYPWDYVLPVKTFIHEIKKDLITNHYPRLVREVTEERALTIKEQADYIAKGTKLEDLPSTKIETTVKQYRIDKILVMKDELILVDENTLQQYAYRMKNSAFGYLRNYRSGKYSNIEEASKAFFDNATLEKELSRAIE